MRTKPFLGALSEYELMRKSPVNSSIGRKGKKRLQDEYVRRPSPTESGDCELRVYSTYIIRTGNLHNGPLAATPLPLFVEKQGPLD